MGNSRTIRIGTVHQPVIVVIHAVVTNFQGHATGKVQDAQGQARQFPGCAVSEVFTGLFAKIRTITLFCQGLQDPVSAEPEFMATGQIQGAILTTGQLASGVKTEGFTCLVPQVGSVTFFVQVQNSVSTGVNVVRIIGIINVVYIIEIVGIIDVVAVVRVVDVIGIIDIVAVVASVFVPQTGGIENTRGNQENQGKKEKEKRMIHDATVLEKQNPRCYGAKQPWRQFAERKKAGKKGWPDDGSTELLDIPDYSFQIYSVVAA